MEIIDDMILLTKMICPDGTELISRHRHEMVEHIDENGVYYMIDGGRDYVRWSGDGREKFVTITTEDDWELIRDNFSRYNQYTRKYTKLKDISDEWLQNILDYFIEHNHEQSRFLDYILRRNYTDQRNIYLYLKMKIIK